MAVHPIDVIDGSTGALLEQMQDPNLALINPVNVPHPFLDVVVSGASGHLFCWRPDTEARTPPALCCFRSSSPAEAGLAGSD